MKIRDTSTPMARVKPEVVAEALGAEPVTYIPPMWIHNRAVVRKKGVAGQDYMLRRMTLAESRVA